MRLRPNLGPVHCSRDPQISFFSKIFIKNWSHGTIHTFKNDFVTVFSVFSNKQYPNRPIAKIRVLWMKFLNKDYTCCHQRWPTND